MKAGTFERVLLGVIAIGLLLTALHVIYDVYAYQHSSIVYFIAKELW